jgi:hypothetical protein
MEKSGRELHVWDEDRCEPIIKVKFSFSEKATKIYAIVY